MVGSISSGSNYLAYLLQEASSSSSSSASSLLSSSTKSQGSMSASDIFDKLTKDLGGDGKTITKSELEDYISTVKNDTTGKYDKGELGFLTQLDNNWDSISGGSDSITASQLEKGMSYLQPPDHNSNSQSSDLFTSLIDAIDSNDDGSLSLDELTKYLKSLISSSESSDSATDTATTTTTSDASTTSTSDADLKKEIKFISELVANFDDFSGGSNSITSNSFYSALRAPQDPLTVTSDQLISPIDISV